MHDFPGCYIAEDKANVVLASLSQSKEQYQVNSTGDGQIWKQSSKWYMKWLKFGETLIIEKIMGFRIR